MKALKVRKVCGKMLDEDIIIKAGKAGYRNGCNVETASWY